MVVHEVSWAWKLMSLSESRVDIRDHCETELNAFVEPISSAGALAGVIRACSLTHPFMLTLLLCIKNERLMMDMIQRRGRRYNTSKYKCRKRRDNKSRST